MKKIALAGSTELARRLIHYLAETGHGSIIGMFDDFEQAGSLKYGHPILGKLSDIHSVYRSGDFDEIFVAIGYNNIEFRKSVFTSLQDADIPIGTFIHPSAYVAESATIGQGCIILINAVVEMYVTLEDNIFVSSVSYISHDVQIGAHSYCAPSITLGGGSSFGPGCFIGISSTIINGITIGENVKIAAGAVVVKDVPDNVLIAGVPATVKKSLA